MDSYKYKIVNNCFVAINKEKNDKKILCNFTATITEEVKKLLDNGNTQISYRIEGKTKSGDLLDPIILSAEDFDKGVWFSKHWGRKAELNIDLPISTALKHLQRAIYEFSKQTVLSTTYSHTGFVKSKSGDDLYLFENGAVTADGIDNTVSSALPKSMPFYHLPEQTPSAEQTKEAIQAVFKLLQFSQKNPYLGLLLSLSAIRAIVSIWLPVEEYVFLVGPKQTFKSSTVKLIQSFFGSWDPNKSLISWESTYAALENFAMLSRNSVLCVDDFVYPQVSNRKNEFTVKAEQFLRAVANRSPKERANNHGHALDNHLKLNCLVVSTGEHPPREVPESLYQRGIYFPVNYGDINTMALTEAQTLANNGVYANGLIAFIQYLLGNYEKNAKLAVKRFKEAAASHKKRLPITDREAYHMASFTVGWRFFREFAESQGVITNEESQAHRKYVNEHFGSLMTKQKKIYSTDIGALFIRGLRKAMKEGRAYVKDAKTGCQPIGVDPSKVGWQDNKPHGLWLGWRRPKQQDIFVRGKLDVDELIALLPEHDQHLFSRKDKSFWKSLKIQNKLKCPESDRNTTRVIFTGAELRQNEHYHVKMRVTDKPKDTDSGVAGSEPNDQEAINPIASKAKMSSKKSKSTKVNPKKEALLDKPLKRF